MLTFARNLKIARRLKRLIISLISILLSSLAATAHPMDSVEVSLLTCSPGEEVWAHYGHTAIRWHDEREGGHDVVFNYGLFSPDAPHFVLRFILGLTDYQLGVESFELFCAQYSYERRGVVEQVLDLTGADKEAILKALEVNLRPENVVYRYNFFYDNCTTRARDLLIGHLHGRVVYPPARRENYSFRDMIHEWNEKYPWSQTGEDILLGVNADRGTSKAQQQFLPDHLRADFARTTYNGKPLVKATRQLLEQPKLAAESSPWLSPVTCALLFALLAVCVFALEAKWKKLFWDWDLLLMVLSGCVGLVLTAMVFSQHPCVSLNLLILIFNPLPLFFAWRATRRTLRRKADRWWTLWAGLTAAGLLGGFFQHYPPAIIVVALILLCNSVMHLWLCPHTGGEMTREK